MQTQSQQPGKASPRNGSHLMDEADIGSGEQTPGERDTEEMIRQIPPLPDSNAKRDDPRPRPGTPPKND